MKTEELLPPLLDLWVAHALAREDETAAVYYGGAWLDGDNQVYLAAPGYGNLSDYRRSRFAPSSDHAQGGPLMDKFGITAGPAPWFGPEREYRALDREHLEWANPSEFWRFGPTRLIAAMRVIVHDAFGPEVPDAPR